MAAVSFGSHANAWNAVATTGGNATSKALHCGRAHTVGAFGHVSGATTLTLQVSEDGATWYDTTATAVTAGDADFSIAGNAAVNAAQWVRLKSSANVTATATIAAKG